MAELGAGGDSHKGGSGAVQSETAPDTYKAQDKKTASNRLSSATSGQNSNHSGNKPDPPPVLRVDDRQRLARERREEREKQLAAREIIWLEKEERARQHYEKHLEERKKRLEEQRLKEERRRAAVEEKRRQRLEEDKERHEAVVRRTMERSQKPRQKHNRWSWGGSLHGSPGIHSAARRLQLSPWESSVVNRLLTPTHSFLARSKSTAALSGDAASCSPIIMPYKAAHSRNPTDRPKLFVTPPEGSSRRRTIHGTAGYKKERERENVPFHLTSGVRRALSPSNPKGRSPAPSRLWLPSKSFPHLPGTPRPASSLPPGSFKAAPAQVRPPSPGNIRPVKREVRVEPEKKDPEKEPQKVASEPSLKGRAPLAKVAEATDEERTPVEPEADPAAPVVAPTPDSAPAPASAPAPSSTMTASASPKTSAGTTDPEEATRLLAEKRRLAREQREKEERERREQEELERQKREELAQRVAEERTRREEEARRLEAEQARQKEEQLRRQAEEREQREREETERAQRQKEEEEARVREEAERVRQEREKHFQREEQERLERKKRLEEIMKRTRKTEATDKKTIDQRNGDIAKGALTGGTEVSALPCVTNSPGNGEPVTSPHVVASHQSKVTVESTPNLEKQPNENGVSVQNENFEEIINLPIGSKPSRLDVTNSESPEIPLNPILAFDDEGTLGPLPQVDGVQSQQTAEVI
ncbi:ensconsin isoform X3 [Lemur catta]|uniref:ensconsin isoform X3 n=1 Tax=Lemur catta TaxID=9447 RepID=UPI001E267692|nr:ensconsin isoform X3 [Lemur catta]